MVIRHLHFVNDTDQQTDEIWVENHNFTLHDQAEESDVMDDDEVDNYINKDNHEDTNNSSKCKKGQPCRKSKESVEESPDWNSIPRSFRRSSLTLVRN